MGKTISLKNRLAVIATSLLATGFFAVATPSFAQAATLTHASAQHSQSSSHKKDHGKHSSYWDYCDYHYCFVDTFNNYPYDGQAFFPHNFVYSTEVAYSIIVGTYPSIPLY
jgi:hypothetical protein